MEDIIHPPTEARTPRPRAQLERGGVRQGTYVNAEEVYEERSTVSSASADTKNLRVTHLAVHSSYKVVIIVSAVR